MDWFAPRRAFAPLVRPVTAVLLCAGAVSGVATWGDGWRRSNADFATIAQFRVDSLSADYVLGRDTDGSARLEATEQVRVAFLDPEAPDADGSDDRAFERVLPTTLDGLSRPIRVLGVADSSGRALPWTSSADDRDVRVRVVDADATVRRATTYVIRYSVDNVVRTDGDSQVLEWGVTGDDWSRSIPRVSAQLSTTPELSGSLATADGDGSQVTLTAAEVGAHDDVRMRTEIRGARFSEPPADEGDTTARATVLGIGGLALAVAGGAAGLAALRRRRARGDHVAVAQSVIPRDLSPALAGSLVGSPARGIVGQLLDAALKGSVRLRPGDRDVLVETVVWPRELSPEADLALSVLAPRSTLRPQALRGRLDLADDGALAQVRDCAIRAGLVRRPLLAPGDRALAVAGTAAAVGVPWLAHSNGAGFAVGAVSLTAALAAVGIGYGLLHAWQSWTPRGVETLGYLEGVRTYLASPQTDRIAFLQTAVGDDHQVTATEERDLYERLLPYAVVLGVQDLWLATAESAGSVERPWLPEGRLHDVLRAVTAGDLVERLDRRIPATPGETHHPTVPRGAGARATGPVGGGVAS